MAVAPVGEKTLLLPANGFPSSTKKPEHDLRNRDEAKTIRILHQAVNADCPLAKIDLIPSEPLGFLKLKPRQTLQGDAGNNPVIELLGFYTFTPFAALTGLLPHQPV